MVRDHHCLQFGESPYCEIYHLFLGKISAEAQLPPVGINLDDPDAHVSK